MRKLFLVVLLLMTTFVDGAFAANVYRFTDRFDGFPKPRTTSGSVLVDGPRYRVELDPSEDPRRHDVVLSTDGGQHEKAVNLDNNTYYDLKPSSEVTTPSYRLLPIGDPSIKGPKIESSEESGETLEGYPTRKVTIQFSYNVQILYHGERIRGTVQSTATYWLTDSISLALPVKLRPKIRTTFAEIDSPLEELIANMVGFPLKQQISITAKVSGEKPETTVLTRTTEAIHPAEATPEDFAVPKGLIYQEPLVAGPGGTPEFPD